MLTSKEAISIVRRIKAEENEFLAAMDIVNVVSEYCLRAELKGIQTMSESFSKINERQAAKMFDK